MITSKRPPLGKDNLLNVSHWVVKCSWVASPLAYSFSEGIHVQEILNWVSGISLMEMLKSWFIFRKYFCDFWKVLMKKLPHYLANFGHHFLEEETESLLFGQLL